MNKTSIEWVKNPDGSQGYTWNPITGCLNGCSYCYARKLAKGRLRSRYLGNKEIAPVHYDTYKRFDGELSQNVVCRAMANPFYPRFWPERLDELDYTTKLKRFTVGGASKVQPKGIFVCDMSDLFGLGIPEEWTRRILDVIKMNHQHRFHLLTKQPQNLIKFSPFPENCWVGVTATSNTLFHQAIRYLLQVEAKVKYISVEPFLESIYTGGMIGHKRIEKITALTYRFIDWLIIGAQTKPYKPPKIEWVEEMVRACDKAGVPVFLKDNLVPLLVASPDPKKAELFYSEMGLRQEMPGLTKERQM